MIDTAVSVFVFPRPVSASRDRSRRNWDRWLPTDYPAYVFTYLSRILQGECTSSGCAEGERTGSGRVGGDGAERGNISNLSYVLTFNFARLGAETQLNRLKNAHTLLQLHDLTFRTAQHLRWRVTRVRVGKIKIKIKLAKLELEIKAKKKSKS